eukprot:Nitzschia sp. Nitz4//scaffold19_size178191//63877//65142//NITZ4_001971-RA/size178191-processed-gene-0.14-mRNA-1//1//CDS//3329540661//1147//frame0
MAEVIDGATNSEVCDDGVNQSSTSPNSTARKAQEAPSSSDPPNSAESNTTAQPIAQVPLPSAPKKKIEVSSGHGPARLGGGSGHRRRSAIPGPTGPKLSWKSDPVASYCDWRIEVEHQYTQQNEVHPDIQSPPKVDIYNLHRNIVGFGVRKSNFLVRAFNRQVEDRNYVQGANVTRISIPANQAEAFPFVLDFMYYTKEVKQTLTAERACCVFKIAELLDIPPLRVAMEEFYQQTLSLKNMADFVGAATKAESERLLFVARAKIGSLIIEKPQLAGLVKPTFMVGILQVNSQQVKELQLQNPDSYPVERIMSQSKIWSKAAYICASHNQSVMTKEIFDAMTSEECLPAIDVSVSFPILMLDAKFDPNNKEYKNLQKRCVTSILDDWDGLRKSFDADTDISLELQKLPSHVLTDILMKSMKR